MEMEGFYIPTYSPAYPTREQLPCMGRSYQREVEAEPMYVGGGGREKTRKREKFRYHGK